MELSFEWDPRKAASNQVKHGIPFEEAISAFADPLVRIFDDPDPSGGERRELLIGHDVRRRLLVVCFVERSIGFASSAHAGRHDRRGRTMKKAPRKRGGAGAAEMRPEYRFDYGKAKPNRFAERVPKNAVAVVLAPDVASVFDSSDSVNSLLRSVIKAMPARGKKARKAG